MSTLSLRGGRRKQRKFRGRTKRRGKKTTRRGRKVRRTRRGGMLCAPWNKECKAMKRGWAESERLSALHAHWTLKKEGRPVPGWLAKKYPLPLNYKSQ